MCGGGGGGGGRDSTAIASWLDFSPTTFSYNKTTPKTSLTQVFSAIATVEWLTSIEFLYCERRGSFEDFSFNLEQEWLYNKPLIVEKGHLQNQVLILLSYKLKLVYPNFHLHIFT